MPLPTHDHRSVDFGKVLDTTVLRNKTALVTGGASGLGLGNTLLTL